MDILSALIDLIAPRRPSKAIVDTTTTKTVEALMRVQYIRGVTCLLPYQHPIVQALITENKFHRSLTARQLLAHVLSAWLLSHLSQKSIWLVPIPLSPTRESVRGYNQVQVITELASPQHPQCLVMPLLVRNRDTAPQTTLGRAARLQNMKGAFTLAPNNNERLSSLPDIIIIVDDVLTTGATMAAAKATLEAHLPDSTRLLTLTIAH